MWYRVFGSLDAVPNPTHIEGNFPQGAVTFVSDATGWYRADMVCENGSTVTMERYLADEDGIRAELNAWAAYLETLDDCPNAGPLMERTIQTRQLITIRKPIDSSNETLGDRLCEALARHLATVTDGFYQIDAKGFFNANGDLLVPE